MAAQRCTVIEYLCVSLAASSTVVLKEYIMGYQCAPNCLAVPRETTKIYSIKLGKYEHINEISRCIKYYNIIFTKTRGSILIQIEIVKNV